MSTNLKTTSLSDMEYVNRVTAERDRAPDLARNLTIRFTSPNFLSTFTLVLVFLIVIKYLIGDFTVLKLKILNFIRLIMERGFTNAFYGSLHGTSGQPGMPGQPTPDKKIVIFIIAAIVIIVASFITVYAMYKNRKNEYEDNEYVVIHKELLNFQNTVTAASHKINRSENKPGGAEFAYAMFVRINRYTPPVGRSNNPPEMIIMQKGVGNPSDTNVANSRNCPSITYANGKLKFYMDIITSNGVGKESFELENIPIKRDFHLIFAVRGRDVDIYIDGTLAKRHQLQGNVAYNSDPARFVLNAGSFEGHLGRILYIRHYPSQNEIESISDPYITQKLVDFIPCGN